jgi:hypothetical protein
MKKPVSPRMSIANKSEMKWTVNFSGLKVPMREFVKDSVNLNVVVKCATNSKS